MAEIDYYKILGVSKDASTSEIRTRYRILAKKFHSDHQGDDSVMSLINEAYHVLSNTQKRYEYDRTNDWPKPNTSSKPRPKQHQTANNRTAKREYTKRSKQSARAQPKYKNITLVSVMSLIFLGILVLVFAYHPSSTNSTASTPTTNSVVPEAIQLVPKAIQREISAEYGHKYYIPTFQPTGISFSTWKMAIPNDRKGDLMLDLAFDSGGTRAVNWTSTSDKSVCSNPVHSTYDGTKEINDRTVYYAKGNHGNEVWSCFTYGSLSYSVWLWHDPYYVNLDSALQMIGTAEQIL